MLKKIRLRGIAMNRILGQKSAIYFHRGVLRMVQIATERQRLRFWAANRPTSDQLQSPANVVRLSAHSLTIDCPRLSEGHHERASSGLQPRQLRMLEIARNSRSIGSAASLRVAPRARLSSRLLGQITCKDHLIRGGLGRLRDIVAVNHKLAFTHFRWHNYFAWYYYETQNTSNNYYCDSNSDGIRRCRFLSPAEAGASS